MNYRPMTREERKNKILRGIWQTWSKLYTKSKTRYSRRRVRFGQVVATRETIATTTFWRKLFQLICFAPFIAPSACRGHACRPAGARTNGFRSGRTIL
jgi:hypothetical protein